MEKDQTRSLEVFRILLNHLTAQVTGDQETDQVSISIETSDQVLCDLIFLASRSDDTDAGDHDNVHHCERTRRELQT
jgi:hypothetical protein